MRRPGVLLGAIAAGLVIAGCAVLTVDVDVYKGALSNHESVQVEQVAAMAMGAKPLLAELRVQLEYRACLDRLETIETNRWGFTRTPINEDHPSFATECQAYRRMKDTARFVSDANALSRQTVRVNAILSLYDDSREGRAGENVRFLEQRMDELDRDIKSGRERISTYLLGNMSTSLALDPKAAKIQIAKYFEDDAASGPLARLLAEESLKPEKSRCTKTNTCGHPGLTDAHLTAVDKAWAAAREAWREAMRLLSSEATRSQLRSDRDALDAVAWVAASLTSIEGIADAYVSRNTSKAELPHFVVRDEAALRELVDRIPAFKDPSLFQARKGNAAVRARVVARGALSELLQEEGDFGRNLATQLLVIQAQAESLGANRSYAAVYPTEALFRQQDNAVFDRDNFDYLRQVFDRIRDTGLNRGRGRDGLEKLIEDYLKTSRRRDVSRENLLSSRDRLLDALINFGEKISVIANLDVLVQESAQGETRKYTRLLQAVGNSIVSQVDALRQTAAHKDRLENARDLELDGLRNAERRAGPALLAVHDDLKATDDFPSRQTILTALRANQSSLKMLVAEIERSLDVERPILVTAQNASVNWKHAMSVVASPDMKAAVATFGLNANRSADAVVRHVVSLLNAQEGKARLPGGAGAAEARRLELAAETLAQHFTGAPWTSNPGSANDKWEDIAREAGRKTKIAEDLAASRGRIVAALDRAHGVTSQLAGGVLRAGIPQRIEKGERDTSAKDVIDVMLATLRYEHVEAVRQNRDSETAKNRLAAVELLYAYRSGMVHIRPAMTFLRNSYPASVLQQDPSANVWRNMLTDHANRQLPLYDFFLSQQEDARITTTIDKQFWQRVNQVRVAGAGRTNYAIAKDDVGNWYVKDYGSNPTDMIRSAQSLAMFAAGPAMGANLLARPGARQTLAAATGRPIPTPALPPRPGETGETGANTGAIPTGPVAAEAPRSTLQRQLERHAKKYNDGTKQARTDLKKDIEGLWGENGSLRAAVRDAVTVDEMAVIAPPNASVFAAPGDTAVFDRLAEDRQDGELKTTAASNKNIADALRAVKQHRLQILARIDKSGGSQVSQTVRESARKAVNDTVRSFIEKVLREREAATGAYEQALTFIGETAGLNQDAR